MSRSLIESLTRQRNELANQLSQFEKLAEAKCDEVKRLRAERDEAREAARYLFGYSDGRGEAESIAQWPWLEEKVTDASERGT